MKPQIIKPSFTMAHQESFHHAENPESEEEPEKVSSEEVEVSIEPVLVVRKAAKKVIDKAEAAEIYKR